MYLFTSHLYLQCFIHETSRLLKYQRWCMVWSVLPHTALDHLSGLYGRTKEFFIGFVVGDADAGLYGIKVLVLNQAGKDF